MSLRRVVALYRRASFSPNQHRTNDRAILDAVTSHLESATWRVVRLDEQEVERGRLPSGDLYLNMCQGPTASERLEALEADDLGAARDGDQWLRGADAARRETAPLATRENQP
ncbi:MAG TPA: hypothetical protein VG692_12485, partial [Gemmatimonadales bacterium]|nr:hypothetical protein [Gemmatimonadales bacterium]